MNTDLVIALLIPWVFWGILAALLCYARRSWFNVLLVAVLVSIPLLLVAAVASARDALWSSLVLHLVALVYFLVSSIGSVRRQRRQKQAQGRQE